MSEELGKVEVPTLNLRPDITASVVVSATVMSPEGTEPVGTEWSMSGCHVYADTTNEGIDLLIINSTNPEQKIKITFSKK